MYFVLARNGFTRVTPVVIWVQVFGFLEMMGVAFCSWVSFEQFLVVRWRDEFRSGMSSAETEKNSSQRPRSLGKPALLEFFSNHFYRQTVTHVLDSWDSLAVSPSSQERPSALESEYETLGGKNN